MPSSEDGITPSERRALSNLMDAVLGLLSLTFVALPVVQLTTNLSLFSRAG